MVPETNSVADLCAAPKAAAIRQTNISAINTKVKCQESAVGSRIIFSIGPAVETYQNVLNLNNFLQCI